jgi:hypothetical protein
VAEITVNRIAIMAAVLSTAAVAVSACSSSSSPPPFGGGDDASMMAAPDSGAPSGDDAAEEPEPMTECDAAIVLPEAGAKGGDCAACLQEKCMPALTTCSTDCVCVRGVECLSVNLDNYTLCPEAMAALGMGNEGLTAIGACLPGSCPVCNPPAN